MNEQLRNRDDLRLIKEAFGLHDDTLAEMQKILCSTYDEFNTSASTNHSTEVWSMGMAYIEAGLDKRAPVKLAHSIQKGILKHFYRARATDILTRMDTAIASKNPRDFVIGIGYFFTTNLTENLVEFSNQVVPKMIGILDSQGM
jgi:hypothetical protein